LDVKPWTNCRVAMHFLLVCVSLLLICQSSTYWSSRSDHLYWSGALWINSGMFLNVTDCFLSVKETVVLCSTNFSVISFSVPCFLSTYLRRPSLNDFVESFAILFFWIWFIVLRLSLSITKYVHWNVSKPCIDINLCSHQKNSDFIHYILNLCGE